MAVGTAERALAALRDLRGATAAAIWAVGSPDQALDLIAVSCSDAFQDEFPARFESLDAARAWCKANGFDAKAVDLEWEPAAGRVGLIAAARRAIGASPATPEDDLQRDIVGATMLTSLESSLEDQRRILAAVLEKTGDAIVAVDSEYRVVWHNASAASLLGRAYDASGPLKCGEYLGCFVDGRANADGGDGPASPGSVSHVEPSLDLSNGTAGECPFRQVLTRGPSVVVADETLIGPPDARFPAAATYLRARVGEVAAIAIIRDLRAGQALNALKSSFVAAVSHELRTPLAVISGYSQSLLDLDLDEAARRSYVERIDGMANRMSGLVGQLLDVVMLESDRLAVDPHRISLGPLLMSIIEETAAIPGSLGVTLSVPPDLPPVYVDPSRIAQVIANLLDNARKYGTPGSMVSIHVLREHDQAIVIVDNEGLEIAVEDRDAVFDLFYRGQEAKSSGTPGIGLGLYLCRRLVEAQGGRIRLEDRPGGTRVAVSLPLAGEEWHTAASYRSAARHRASGDPEADDGQVSDPGPGPA